MEFLQQCSLAGWLAQACCRAENCDQQKTSGYSGEQDQHFSLSFFLAPSRYLNVAYNNSPTFFTSAWYYRDLFKIFRMPEHDTFAGFSGKLLSPILFLPSRWDRRECSIGNKLFQKQPLHYGLVLKTQTTGLFNTYTWTQLHEYIDSLSVPFLYHEGEMMWFYWRPVGIK